ncbi:MAG TPA: hypothetical protein VMW82_01440 [Candidatus Paceibacterota bacterium]|nr:hypothetical protein [Patescibacteria group bacterium]MBU4458288.1 hypothetical protein [Patescibacteria group bacterium]MCG2696203.1 hypothetical protein [Candidatus Portnoybacteria bacterium]HUT96216.1 hypothetical protein [Candidatus Paceibacterota bacterium]
MFKCPKCGYQSEVAGNCPTDNEVLVEELGTEQESNVTPPTADESIPTGEESKPTEE